MFVYKALLEALQSGDTTIPSNDMEVRFAELKQTNAKTGKTTTEEQFAVSKFVSLIKPHVTFTVGGE